MSDTIRWGVLGASNFARKHMARAIHFAEGASLSALATSNPEKAEPFQAFAPDLQVFSDYEALLNSDQIDAVYIPLPNHLHVEWTQKAMDAGKHVLCEKPIALRADQIDALIAKREETGLQACEAYMIVHHPQWQRVQQLVQDGAIGKLAHVDGAFSFDNSADTQNIRHNADMGGGGIRDIGVYTYGATRWVTGQEPEISHVDLTYENGVDVIARVSAKFPDFSAHWVNSMRMHAYQQMTFHGTNGVIRLSAPFNANVYGEARIELHQPDLGLRVERFPGVDHYVLQVEAFGRAIRGEAAFAWSLEQAKGTQKVIDAVFAAARDG
ncbi:Gfo/Idh/MocA family protein [Aestuariibius sp. HNIBRBA575]|uniref:Gfo/Idh/MocA family protein n=1 Tax=Aestuariibius sp. HNIBRBA575 TaxID=3233343 RepID=UPI0034A24948